MRLIMAEQEHCTTDQVKCYDVTVMLRYLSLRLALARHLPRQREALLCRHDSTARQAHLNLPGDPFLSVVSRTGGTPVGGMSEGQGGSRLRRGTRYSPTITGKPPGRDDTCRAVFLSLFINRFQILLQNHIDIL